MLLNIVHYGHPALRKKGAEIKGVTNTIRQLARDMIETMYANHGLGLAAQQIGKALQLTVIDVRGTDRPSQVFLGVREASLDSMMPLVLINPKITRKEGEEMGKEGCLSFPGLTEEISRAATVHVSATDMEERPLQFIVTGLLGRAVQHEIDHLNGILFIDRMPTETRKKLDDVLRKMEKETMDGLKRKRK